MNTVSVAPDGLWLKTHFYREGAMLHMVAYSCAAGTPEVFKASVDLRPIIARVVKMHSKLHGKVVSGEDVAVEVGISLGSVLSAVASPVTAMNAALEKVPGVSTARRAVMNQISPSMNQAYEGMLGADSLVKSAARAVTRTGKAKLASQVSASLKSAVGSRSPSQPSSAFSFPSVSMSAVAAFNAANSAVTAIDQHKAAAKLVADLAKNPNAKLKAEANKWAGSVIKKAVADKVTLPSNLKSTIAQAVALTKGRADKARAVIAATNAKANAGSVEAKKLSRVISLAHSARQQLKHVSSARPDKGRGAKVKSLGPSTLNGFPAVLVTSTGKVIPGRYLEKKGAPVSTVLRGGKIYRGNFAAVSGVFGEREVVGCSNPFTLPAESR